MPPSAEVEKQEWCPRQGMRRSEVAREMRLRVDELALASAGGDDSSVGSVDSAKSNKSGKSTKSKKGSGGCYKERVGIDALGGNVHTHLNRSQDAKFQKTTRKIAEHVSKEHGSEQHELVMFGEEPVFTELTKPTTTKALDIAEWKMDRDDWNKEVKKCKEAKSATFVTMMGQCVSQLRTAMESRKECSTILRNRGVVALKAMIESRVCGKDESQNSDWVLTRQMRKLHLLKPDKGEPPPNFGERC